MCYCFFFKDHDRDAGSSGGARPKQRRAPPTPDCEWEVNRQAVNLMHKLGEGAFGEVWKSSVVLANGQTVTAVKFLRGDLIDHFMGTISDPLCREIYREMGCEPCRACFTTTT